MKRTLILAVCLWLFSATFAFAVPRIVSYNPSHGARIIVLAQWIVGGTGYNLTSTIEYTVQNGCKQVWRQYWRGLVAVGEPILLGEFCP